MKKNLIIAILMTLATTVLLGLVYPLVVTAMAQVLMKDKANGQLISKDGKVIGSRIIGQSFTGERYFHSRPSAAGPATMRPTLEGRTWGRPIKSSWIA